MFLNERCLDGVKQASGMDALCQDFEDARRHTVEVLCTMGGKVKKFIIPGLLDPNAIPERPFDDSQSQFMNWMLSANTYLEGILESVLAMAVCLGYHPDSSPIEETGKTLNLITVQEDMKAIINQIHSTCDCLGDVLRPYLFSSIINNDCNEKEAMEETPHSNVYVALKECIMGLRAFNSRLQVLSDCVED